MFFNKKSFNISLLLFYVVFFCYLTSLKCYVQFSIFIEFWLPHVYIMYFVLLFNFICYLIPKFLLFVYFVVCLICIVMLYNNIMDKSIIFIIDCFFFFLWKKYNFFCKIFIIYSGYTVKVGCYCCIIC